MRKEKSKPRSIRVLALTGKMGAGKSTVATIIEQMFSPVKIMKFAQPLYDIQSYAYGRVGRTLPKEGKNRKLLQFLGTEWGRDQLDKDVWCKLWYRDVALALRHDKDLFVVCDDLRFDNEAVVAQKMGALIVEVQSSQDRINKVNTGHASEQGIHEDFIDAVIVNDGSMQMLTEQVAYLITTAGTKEDCYEG